MSVQPLHSTTVNQAHSAAWRRSARPQPNATLTLVPLGSQQQHCTRVSTAGVTRSRQHLQYGRAQLSACQPHTGGRPHTCAEEAQQPANSCSLTAVGADPGPHCCTYHMPFSSHAMRAAPGFHSLHTAAWQSPVLTQAPAPCCCVQQVISLQTLPAGTMNVLCTPSCWPQLAAAASDGSECKWSTTT